MAKSFIEGVRPSGDLFGVFEIEAGVAHFYLYDARVGPAGTVLGAIRISASRRLFLKPAAIIWSKDERYVGLLINGKLAAAFEAETKVKWGGDIDKIGEPTFPLAIAQALAPS